jgi:hypothetical protein
MESGAMVESVDSSLQTKTTLHASLDFQKPGKQTGFIQVPHSAHDDAWGVIPVPIAVISNEPGPTVILEGGNHGDEHEGPIVLGELIRTLDPGAVAGRLIFIPAINLPAVAAARRASPFDDLNFNRAFPGDPLGSPTQRSGGPRWRVPGRFRSTRWPYAGEASTMSSHISARCRPRWPTRRKRPRRSTSLRGPTLMS